MMQFLSPLRCALILVSIFTSGIRGSSHHHHHGGEGALKANGCQEYNYRYPYDCNPLSDCSFLVRWAVLLEDGSGSDVVKASNQSLVWNAAVATRARWVEYQVTAFVPSSLSDSPSSLWLALGFSSNQEMGDTDVVTCWYSHGNYSIHAGYNLPDGHQFKLYDNPSAGLKLLGANYLPANRSLQCRFSRRINNTLAAPDSKVLSEGDWYVLLGMGALGEDGTNLVGNALESVSMLEHQVVAVSECQCDVLSCGKLCDCSESGFAVRLLKLHGVVMCMTFMFLFPLGALLSRYYKAVFHYTWFKMHVAVVIIGVFWSLVGLLLVLWHTKMTFEPGYHQIVGVALLALVVAQPAMGCFRPPKGDTTKRRLFVCAHKSVAVVILLGSALELFLGLWLYHSQTRPFSIANLCLFLVINVAFVIALEVLKHFNKFSSEVPVIYHKVKKTDELSDTEDEVFMKEDFTKQQSHKESYRLEKLTLLMFVVGNLLLTTCLACLIYYFNPGDH